MQITATALDQDGLTGTRYTMLDGDVEIGWLDAHDTGLILNVEVVMERRGEGVARALYEHADEAQGLYHAPEWGRSAEGDTFASAMGGDVMDDEQAAEIVGFDLTTLETDEEPEADENGEPLTW